MGTNFYLLSGSRYTDDPQYHIGKRSAAGLYCWDCGRTLCKDGISGIHYYSDWHKKCPICGKAPVQEDLSSGSAGRELGFNKSGFAPKTGVASCSSFNWAMPPEQLKKRRFVKDEYGSRYTIKEFHEMLTECPIQFMDSIGKWFS